MWPIVKILWILNWWIGSIGRVSRSSAGQAGFQKIYSRLSACGLIRNDACRPHHVDHAGREAEQEEHDETPGRGRQQTVEPPADRRTDNNTRDQFGGKAKTARKGRCPRRAVIIPCSGLV